MAIQTPKDVLKFAKDNKVEAVDLKFLDLLGLWQHFTIPPSELTEELFEEGNGFDGSSIRGWQPIHASDMLVVPDPTDRKSTRLNSSHRTISYAVFCLKKKTKPHYRNSTHP